MGFPWDLMETWEVRVATGHQTGDGTMRNKTFK